MTLLNRTLTMVSAFIFACTLLMTAHASEIGSHAKKHATARKAAPKPPSVEEQIKALETNLEQRINSLENRLSAKDVELEKAQHQLADAEVAMSKAGDAAKSQQALVDENTNATSRLQAAVTGLKTEDDALATRVSTETASLRKSIESPATLHFKGITFTPYGFFNGESVYRTHATGGEMPTPWSAIPYESADSYSLSETFLSGRQSRVGVTAVGATRWGTLRAIFEADFLGVGTTSNDNQSSSYIFRQRIALAEAETKNHWAFSGGQGWSLTKDVAGNIAQASGGVRDANDRVSQTAEVSKSIAKDIAGVNLAVSDIRQGGEHVQASAVELSKLAEQLGGQVAQFRT